MFTTYSIARKSITALLLGMTLAACGGPPAVTTRPETASPATTVETRPEATIVPEGTATPVETTRSEASAGGATNAAAACAGLSAAIGAIVGTEVTQTEASLDDYVAGTTREGCQLTANWTGAQLDDFVAVSRQVSALLGEQGWSEDQRYAADGPTGTVLGFTQENLVAILGVDWRPAPEVQCPTDKPIMECSMLPEQRLYNLTLKIANTAGDGTTATPEATDVVTTPEAG